MFHAKERIVYLSKVAMEQPELRFEKLYKIIQRQEFLEHAWEQIRTNKGSTTAGIDRVTRTEFDPEVALKDLSEELRNGTFQPLPVRRVEIPKPGKKGKRPLGIPTLKDRVVQSAIKCLLQAIYEPLFLDTSHGFRPKRSCQTAVNDITCRKYDWVVEGDIKGCFDNVKHGILLTLLRKRIKDEKFLSLINKFLKSGYQMGFGEDGKYPIYETTTGTPQGGIVSPILANIYLHEFDKYMQCQIKNMDRKDIKESSGYVYFTTKIVNLRRALKEERIPYYMFIKEDIYANGRGKRINLHSREELVSRLRWAKKERKKYPKYDKSWYFNNKSLGYVRYADDFVILLGNYTKTEAQQIKAAATKWFSDTLNLELSPEKTKITHATKGFTFLGYDLLRKPKADGVGYADKYASIYTPHEKKKMVLERIDKALKAGHNFPTVDMIIALNRIITGWGNYHRIANNWRKTASALDHKLYWKVMRWIARKHDKSVAQTAKGHVKYGVKAYGRKVMRITATSGEKTVHLKWFYDCAYENPGVISARIKGSELAFEYWMITDNEKEEVEIIRAAETGNSKEDYYKTVAEQGKFCASCLKDDAQLIVHHTKMLRRARRKSDKDIYQANKSSRKILVCRECHHKIHNR